MVTCGEICRLCVGLLFTVALSHTEAKIFDLSHHMSQNTIYWPGMPKWNYTQLQHGPIGAANVFIAFGAYSTAEHGGTHIDAPKHFTDGGLDVASVPLDSLIANGVKIDIKKECEANRSYALTVDRIKEWEQVYGRIPSHSALLVYTGWSTKWPSYEQVMGTRDETDPSLIRFPFLSGEAGKFLSDERNIKILAVDMPSPDDPQTPDYPVHRAILPKNKVIVENVNIPANFPTTGFRFYAVPLAIKGGSGTPLRVFAITDETSMLMNRYSNSSARSTNPLRDFSFIIGILFFYFLF